MQAEHLYVHVPFCSRRCIYCDFSIAVRPRVPVDEYLAGVAREWDQRHAESRFALKTLYLGGGTPSKLGADGIARLMDLVRERAEILPLSEVTLEANPEDLCQDTAQAWRAAGINRLSLGVQSFDPDVLTWMHRSHDPAGALRAVETAREAGFENISIDLIFGAPESLRRAWGSDIETAIRLELPHVSVYGLTVEPRTPLGRWVARRQVGESTEEAFEEEFLQAHDLLTAAGLEHYEVSNYGRTGLHSQHNWGYWRRGAYGGLGPSAHEFDGRARRWNVAPYAHWLERTESDRPTTEGSEILNDVEELAERTYLGLRSVDGLALTAQECEHIKPWLAAGWATLSQNRSVQLTATGWLRLDALSADLTHLRSPY